MCVMLRVCGVCLSQGVGSPETMGPGLEPHAIHYRRLGQTLVETRQSREGQETELANLQAKLTELHEPWSVPRYFCDFFFVVVGCFFGTMGR